MQVTQSQSSTSSPIPEISASSALRNRHEQAREDFAVTLAERQQATAASLEASEAGRPDHIEAEHTSTPKTRSDASDHTRSARRATHAPDTTRPSASETSEQAPADRPAHETTSGKPADSAARAMTTARAGTAEPVARVTVEPAGGLGAADYMTEAVRLAANSTAHAAAETATEPALHAAAEAVTPQAPQALETVPLQAIAKDAALDIASASLPQSAPEKSAVLAALLESEPATASVTGGAAATQELEGLAAVLQDIAALSEEAVTIQTGRVQAVSAPGETLTGAEAGVGGTAGQAAEAGQILTGLHAAEFSLDTAAVPEVPPNASGAPELPPERATLGTVHEITVRGIRYLTSRDGRTMTIKLVPASLGELHLEIASTRDGLYVRLVSANATVREALGAELQNLRDALAQGDLDVAGITIASELDAGQAQVGHDSGAAQSGTGAASGSPAQATADEDIEGTAPVAMTAAAPHEGTLDVVA